MLPALRHLKKSDPLLARLIRQIGPCQMQYRPPTFEALARSIVYQQLHGKAAVTIYGRLAAAAAPAGELDPALLLRLTSAELRALGLSNQKARYLQELATHTVAGQLVFADLPALADDEVIRRLTTIKGIGEWTAQMFLMFALQRPDVLPTGDLGIRTGMKRLYALEELPNPAQMRTVAEPWRPYRSIASWYLWRSLDGTAEG